MLRNKNREPRQGREGCNPESRAGPSSRQDLRKGQLWRGQLLKGPSAWRGRGQRQSLLTHQSEV